MEYTDITLPSGERISGGRCEAIVSAYDAGLVDGPVTSWQCTRPAQGQCPVCKRIYCDGHALGHWQQHHTPADLYTPDD